MATASYKKLNLPLPPDMHEAIFSESKMLGVPATRLVRSVLESWLEERRRARRKEAIRRFAAASAGTNLDLDPDLEAAATQELNRFYEEDDAAR
jgi:hypothetical protein